MPLGRTFTKKLQKLNNAVASRMPSSSKPGSEASTPSGSSRSTSGDYFYSVPFEQTSTVVDTASSSSDVDSMTSATDASSSTSREPVTPSSGISDSLIMVNAKISELQSSTTPRDLLALLQEKNASSSTTTRLPPSPLLTPPHSSTTSSSRPSTSSTTPAVAPLASQIYRERTNSNPVLTNLVHGSHHHHNHHPVPHTTPATPTTITDSWSISSIYTAPLASPSNSPASAAFSESLYIADHDGSIGSFKYPLPKEAPLAADELQKLEEDARADEMAMNILEKVSADDYVREIKTGSWYI